MLIVVASNDPIKNPALASRFVHFTFPKPRPEALAAYAFELAKKSKYLAFTHTPINSTSIAQWIAKQGTSVTTEKAKEKESGQTQELNSTTTTSSEQAQASQATQGINNFRDVKYGVAAFCRAQHLNHSKHE